MVMLKAKRLVPARARPPAKALYWHALPRALRLLLVSGARQVLGGDLTRRMKRYPAPPS